MEDGSFWDDATKAQQIVGQANTIKRKLLPFLKLDKSLDDLKENPLNYSSC
jgi:hypothetical protein